MIDNVIQRTRCGICDAEHEYKEGKVPAPRRKTQPPALFTQVLDNLNGSTPRPQPPPASAAAPVTNEPAIEEPVAMAAAVAVAAPVAAAVAAPAVIEAAHVDVAETLDTVDDADEPEEPEAPDSGFRRSLIRATFPRPDGPSQNQQPRALPDFTIQSLNNRRNNNQRHAGGQNKFRGGRRRPGGGNPNQDNIGPMRFRDHGHGQDRPQGQGNGNGNGGGGRRRRGGKKNR